MSNQGTPPHGAGTMVEPGGPDDRTPARVDDTRGSSVGIPERFENPGLPAHVHRLADHDPAAGKRAERQVATMFGASMLATLVFIVAFWVLALSTVAQFPRSAGIGVLILLAGIPAYALWRGGAHGH